MTTDQRRRLWEKRVFVYRAATAAGRRGYVVEDCSGRLWFPTLEEAERFLHLAGLI